MLSSYKWLAVLILGLGYSVAVWHVSHKYHATAWEKEKATTAQNELKAERENGKLVLEAVAQLDGKISKLRTTQTTIQQRVIRETIKEPVYTQCVTTDGVVRDIEAVIDAGNSVSTNR